MSAPKDNNGATKKANCDAASGIKANTQGWSAPLHETYETIHNAQTKKFN